MKDKIANLMKSEGLTSSRLAEILETQPSRISHILSGRNNPSFDLLQKILKRFPSINPDWLMLDSDVMYRDANMQTPPPSDSNTESGSEPIDLFGLDGAAMGDFAFDFAGGSDSDNATILSTFNEQNQGVNCSQNSTENWGQNSVENRAQFASQNRPKNAPQNGVKNTSQNTQNLQPSRVTVERIIVLYSDGTFRSYGSR